MSPFILHPRLAAGSHALGKLGSCHVLLKDNALFPWLLIVPEVTDGIEDLHQLDEVQYLEVCRTIRSVSGFVSAHFKPEKLNVACIGNQVRQMHIHIVGRSSTDPAWPGTVWAYSGKKHYRDETLEQIRDAFRSCCKLTQSDTI